MDRQNNNRDATRYSKPLWFLLISFLCASYAIADSSSSIDLVLSANKSYYQKTAAHIESAVKKAHPNTSITIGIAEQKDWPQNGNSLVVAVGSSACEQALKKTPSNGLLCTFLPRSTYLSLIAKHTEKATGSRSAIFFDQPMQRYFALMKIITPKAKKLGTAVGPQSTQLLPAIEQLSQEYQFALLHTELTDSKSHLKSLSSVVASSQIFLVNPDKAELNKTVARTLLHLSIRQRIPVIAYSGSYVNAGALAAIYSTPDNIGEDASKVINQWLSSQDTRLPPPGYPEFFTIKSNPHVARSLRIKLPGDRNLEQAVRQYMVQSSPEGGTP
ncbi:hypothetical protein KFE80_08625 [bacterium SCSIO 12696]|nr:hypothetical protein KFE80_08625 [bacterium SCSIO 12696]